MKLESKAKQYAEALFNVSTQSSSEKAVRNSLKMVNSAIKASPEFRAFLFSKRITEVQKATAVKEALWSEMSSNCFRVYWFSYRSKLS